MLYINGEWRPASDGATFAVTNPANGQIIGEVADASTTDIDDAINAAAAAGASWAASTAYQRAAILEKAEQLLRREQKRLAQLMVEEQGKAYKFAFNEVAYAADFLGWFAAQAKRVYGRIIPSSRPNHQFQTTYHPMGVVAAITPWNYPISMITRKLGPALAAGCTVVLKPAETTPLCAIETIKLLIEAGLPAGVVNIVNCATPKRVGDMLVSHPAIDKLTFTGSTAVGRQLAREAAGNLKRLSMELGGHAPFMVMADADPVHAAKGLSLVKFLNTGQACISPNRVYVHERQLDDFLAELSKRVAKLQIGAGSDPAVTIGPLNNAAAVVKMQQQVDDARDKGATVVMGGKAPQNSELAGGHFFEPTIITNISQDMLIYQQETFGPIIAIMTYADEAALLAEANNTEYGLAAYVYTQSQKTAQRMIDGLSFGIIGINDINPTSASVPFGGMKNSGMGREGGEEGIYEYLEVKSVGISL